MVLCGAVKLPIHVTMLETELQRRQERNPRYSLRGFAVFLGLHPSALSRILNGKQELSVPAALQIMRKLKLSPEDQERFIVSVAQSKYSETLTMLYEAAEIHKLETSLRESEERYRALFDLVDQALEICELVRDESGKVVDVRILRVNPAWEKVIGVNPEQIIGKRASEWLPNFEQFWIDLYDRVVHSGKPERAEQYVSDLDRWFEVYVAPTEGDRFIVFASDTSARKKQEVELQQRERRKTVLLQITDVFRSATDAAEIKKLTAIILGEFLQVDRCFYMESRPDLGANTFDVKKNYCSPGTKPFEGPFNAEEFSPVLLAMAQHGRPMAYADAAQIESLQPYERENLINTNMVAAVFAPITKQGQLIGGLYLHQSHPRAWHEDDVWLAQEIAERTWATVERVRAEQSLKESEARLRNLFANNMVAMAVWTPAGEIVDANDRYLELIGYTRDELNAGMVRWPDFTPPEFLHLDKRAIAEVQEKGYCQPFEKYYKHRDGHIIPVMIGGGRFDRHRETGVVYAVDLTDRMRVENEYRVGKEKFEAIADVADHVPDLLWRSEVNGHATWFNQRWLNHTGQTLKEALKKPWMDSVHPEDRETFVRKYQEAIRARRSFEHMCRIREGSENTDGDCRWFLVRIEPAMDRNGRLTHLYGVATDIHEIWSSLEALRHHEESANTSLSPAH